MTNNHDIEDPQVTELRNILYILAFVWFLTAMLAGDQISKNEQKDKTLIKGAVVIGNLLDSITELSVVDSLYQIQSQINLRIHNVVPEEDLKVLQDDPEYMELCSKLQ